MDHHRIPEEHSSNSLVQPANAPSGDGPASAVTIQQPQAGPSTTPHISDITSQPVAATSPDPRDPHQTGTILTNLPVASATERVVVGSTDNLIENRPLPPVPQHQTPEASREGSGIRARIGERYPSIRPRQGSGVDWIIPLDEKPIREKTAGERLEPTLLTAIAERNKCAFNAKMTGYALNAAIGLQVLIGSLTTGLSVVTSGRHTSITTAILGGLATIIASYLARARGSNEPELSIARVKDLEQFIRECEAFKMDHGHTLGNKFDASLERFRKRFEELLGNANSERRLAPPA